VIVTPEVGLASMVRDFQCGIVVDGSAREIAAAVSQLDTNLTLATQLGSRGCAAARAHLSWSAVAEQMERAYESAMRAKLCGSRS
jgi:glycosyltransferase involved in cell wall biosynthesis